MDGTVYCIRYCQLSILPTTGLTLLVAWFWWWWWLVLVLDGRCPKETIAINIIVHSRTTWVWVLVWPVPGKLCTKRSENHLSCLISVPLRNEFSSRTMILVSQYRCTYNVVDWPLALFSWTDGICKALARY